MSKRNRIPQTPPRVHDAPLRVAQIGYGVVGRNRAEALSQLPGEFQLAWIVDGNEGSAQRGAEKYRCRSATTYDRVPLDEIDVAIVSTWTDQHLEHALHFLNHGKHVLVEKPLAASVGECRKMLQAASANHVELKTGFQLLYAPSIRKGIELLKAGAVGKIRLLRGQVGHSQFLYVGDERIKSEIRDRGEKILETGGGPMIDLGVHALDIGRLILDDGCDEEDMLSAVSRTRTADHPQLPVNVDSDVTSTFQTTRTGRQFNLTASYAYHQPYMQVLFEVRGEHGQLQFSEGFERFVELFVTRAHADGCVQALLPAASAGAEMVTSRTIASDERQFGFMKYRFELAGDGGLTRWIEELKDFHRKIGKEEVSPLYRSGDDGLRAQQLLTEALELDPIRPLRLGNGRPPKRRQNAGGRVRVSSRRSK